MAARRGTAKERAWLEARRQHITSTDLAVIMGIPGAFGSPMDVWQEKKGLLEKGEMPRQLEAGLRLQPIILEWYADKRDVAIEHADPFELTVCEAHPILAASLDARHTEGDQRPVDAKNIRYRDPQEWGEDGSSDFPAKYIVQLHGQMECTKTQVADLAALFSGFDHGWFTVERDPEIAAGCIEAAEEFWTRYVQADVPPPVDGSNAWTKWLSSRRKKQQLEFQPSTPGDLLGLELRRVYGELDKAEERKAEVANRMREAMGDAEVALGSFGRISFSWGHDRAETDHEAFAAVLEGKLLELDPGARPFVEQARKKFTTIKPATRTFRPTFREG